MRAVIAGFCLLATSVTAVGGEADVVAAKVAKEAGGTYRFDVTVRHEDTGWEHYADRFEIVAPDGTILGTRILYHPHVDEQPFTRSLSGVNIPSGLETVTVRAHDKLDGFGGKSVQVNLPR